MCWSNGPARPESSKAPIPQWECLVRRGSSQKICGLNWALREHEPNRAPCGETVPSCVRWHFTQLRLSFEEAYLGGDATDPSRHGRGTQFCLWILRKYSVTSMFAGSFSLVFSWMTWSGGSTSSV